MSELLFGAAAFTLMGYLIGKLFVGFNPVLLLVGAFFLFGTWSILSELENKNFATIFFILGAILNFNRPLTYVRSLISDAIGTMKLRKLSSNYVSTIETQKHEAERELYEQKRQVEEDLRRQKQEAEQDIQRQRREAEEAIKREAENLRREREKYQQSSHNSQSNQSQNNSQQSNSSTNDKKYLNPLVFADACEILGLSQGKTLKEYKRAYLQLMKLYHSDKLTGLSDDLRKQEEEKAKLMNMAWGTIRKKLR